MRKNKKLIKCADKTMKSLKWLEFERPKQEKKFDKNPLSIDKTNSTASKERYRE